MNKGGRMQVPVSGQVTGVEESEMLEAVANSKQFAGGALTLQFEHDFAAFMGYKFGLFVNSGSSADLLMQSIQNWRGPVRVSGCSFPTTVNTIIQSGHTPYFVDIELGTYMPKVVDVGCHFLGNWCKAGAIVDSCDGMFPGEDKRTATFSFYPAHFMTTGEGGMVVTNNANEYQKMRSFRDWGRDCWCAPGFDNTCGRRFDHKVDGIEYDHKYIYSRIGYNLKNTEMAAAVGIAQLKKLPRFLDIRRRNFKMLYEAFKQLEDVFILPVSVKADTAWFGFPLTLRDGASIKRRELIAYLDEQGIATRMMFGGNITRHPAYKDADYDADALPNCDKVMRDGFWIGCWHGLDDSHINYTIEKVYEYILKR